MIQWLDDGTKDNVLDVKLHKTVIPKFLNIIL